MNKILHVVFALSVSVSPVLAWGEGGCSFSKKDKASQVENIDQVENNDSSDK